MYVVMTNDCAHALFSNEAVADAYAKAGNEYDKRKNPDRVVFYNVHPLELNEMPPFYGETTNEAIARRIKETGNEKCHKPRNISKRNPQRYDQGKFQ